ncbi:SpoIIE family protein phosphatase [Streptomyces sp. NEAU-PBA10]|uniref:PPM-type phosphatase domain-containing protein n=1 Tax=Streptomyces tremellae TaxID=1124239 RepID=A0ABP7DYQ3_9ACTN
MNNSVIIGTAQRPGTEAPCADGHDVQRTGDRVTAAVVDGAGHHPDTVRYAGIAPAVITHIGARLGGLAGLITAGQMAHAYDRPPHVSAVYARIEPGRAGILWIGDCRAYGWNGSELTRFSTDQTMGEFLRVHGDVPAPIVEHHNAWARLGLAQASAATCREAEIPDDVTLVLLCSDGVSDQVDQATWRELCTTHAGNPQSLADALVAAAVTDDKGYRDDATVVVLLRRRDEPAFVRD